MPLHVKKSTNQNLFFLHFQNCVDRFFSWNKLECRIQDYECFHTCSASSFFGILKISRRENRAKKRSLSVLLADVQKRSYNKGPSLYLELMDTPLSESARYTGVSDYKVQVFF